MPGPKAYHVENMFAMFGDSDSIQTVTVVYDIESGEGEESYAAGATYYAEFFTNDGQYPWMQEGKFENVDAFMNITIDANMIKGTKVTVNSVDYIVDSVNRKRNGTDNLYDFCLLIGVDSG